MTLHITLDESQYLQATVSGDLDCELAHELLQRVRIYWHAGAQGVNLDLGGVGQTSDCTLTVLLSLSEMLEGNLNLERCSDELQAAYVAGLLGECSLPQPLARCTNCLQGKEQWCDRAVSRIGERPTA